MVSTLLSHCSHQRLPESLLVVVPSWATRFCQLSRWTRSELYALCFCFHTVTACVCVLPVVCLVSSNSIQIVSSIFGMYAWFVDTCWYYIFEEQQSNLTKRAYQWVCVGVSMFTSKENLSLDKPVTPRQALSTQVTASCRR